MSTPADTFTDRTDATDEEFRARVAVFDAAEEPEEVVVIRAMLDLAAEMDREERHAGWVLEPADRIRRGLAALAALRGDRG